MSSLASVAPGGPVVDNHDADAKHGAGQNPEQGGAGVAPVSDGRVSVRLLLTNGGRSFNVEVDPATPFSQLKQQHFSQELASGKNVRFLTHGRVLSDSLALKDYPFIAGGTTIHVHVTDLPAGVPAPAPAPAPGSSVPQSQRQAQQPARNAPPPFDFSHIPLSERASAPGQISISGEANINHFLALVLMMAWSAYFSNGAYFGKVGTGFLVLVTGLFFHKLSGMNLAGVGSQGAAAPAAARSPQRGQSPARPR